MLSESFCKALNRWHFFLSTRCDCVEEKTRKPMMCLCAASHSTTQAEDGSMNLSHALQERMRAMNCTPDHVRRFVEKYPPETRMTKVKFLRAV